MALFWRSFAWLYDTEDPSECLTSSHQRTQICEFAEKKIGFFPYPVETIHANTRIL